MERAILPASYPKCQWSRCGSSCSGSRKTMTTRRIANATRTIESRNDGKRRCLEIWFEIWFGTSASPFELEESDKTNLILAVELFHNAGSLTGSNPCADAPHGGQVIMQIVDGIQNLRQ